MKPGVSQAKEVSEGGERNQIKIAPFGIFRPPFSENSTLPVRGFRPPVRKLAKSFTQSRTVRTEAAAELLPSIMQRSPGGNGGRNALPPSRGTDFFDTADPPALKG